METEQQCSGLTEEPWGHELGASITDLGELRQSPTVGTTSLGITKRRALWSVCVCESVCATSGGRRGVG